MKVTAVRKVKETRVAKVGTRGPGGAAAEGAGDMTTDVYDPTAVAGDTFDRANHHGEQSTDTVTGLDAALATFLVAANDLSDIISAATARGNLGLGSAAERDVGTGDGNLVEVISGKIASSLLPALAITETFVVASEVAMLALSAAETGDVAVRTDENKSYILAGSDPSVLGDWQVLLTPVDTVLSVNAQTGAVVISAAGLGALVAANNLSDLASASAARTNLELGSAATHADTEYPHISGATQTITAETVFQNDSFHLKTGAGSIAFRVSGGRAKVYTDLENPALGWWLGVLTVLSTSVGLQYLGGWLGWDYNTGSLMLGPASSGTGKNIVVDTRGGQVRTKAGASQSVDVQQWQTSGGSIMASIAKNGAFKPASLADSAAENGTIYYSTDAGKLVYKDSGGTVNNLY